jgi:hypothetical protein
MDIIDYDWLETQSGGRLHHAAISVPGKYEDVVEALWDGYGDDVRLDCGRIAKRVWIPGPFTRMGMVRCGRCCAANGLPRGIGSPKNDNECRRILGLPVKGSA